MRGVSLKVPVQIYSVFVYWMSRIYLYYNIPFRQFGRVVVFSVRYSHEDAVFVNNGDEPSGMTFVFTFTGNVSGIKIQDKYTGNVFCVNYKFCSYDILKMFAAIGYLLLYN